MQKLIFNTERSVYKVVNVSEFFNVPIKKTFKNFIVLATSDCFKIDVFMKNLIVVFIDSKVI